MAATMTVRAHTEDIRPSDAKLGDIVHAHGSRFRLTLQYSVGEASGEAGSTPAGWHGAYLGPVTDAGHESIPRSWLKLHDCVSRCGNAECWHMQGNDRMRWTREIPEADFGGEG